MAATTAPPAPSGATGDYFTSPTDHPLFGALLAAQLRQMWDVLGRPASFTVLEPGAGSGVMAMDIVDAALADFPDFAKALRYMVIDYTPTVPGGQRSSGMELVASNGLPARGVMGCILSNELLDALPVHRYVVEGGGAREVYVALDGDGFAEVLGAPSTPDAARLLAEIGPGLPDGFRGEVCPAAALWITEAAASP